MLTIDKRPYVDDDIILSFKGNLGDMMLRVGEKRLDQFDNVVNKIVKLPFGEVTFDVLITKETRETLRKFLD